MKTHLFLVLALAACGEAYDGATLSETGLHTGGVALDPNGISQITDVDCADTEGQYTCTPTLLSQFLSDGSYDDKGSGIFARATGGGFRFLLSSPQTDHIVIDFTVWEGGMEVTPLYSSNGFDIIEGTPLTWTIIYPPFSGTYILPLHPGGYKNFGFDAAFESDTFVAEFGRVP